MSYNGVGLTVQSILTGASSLAAIIAFIVLITRLMRHRLMTVTGQPNRTLKLCETLPIDPKRRVHLLECEGGRVLLLTGGSQDQFLGWVPAK
jgi:flagellar biogenesis protein FliO